MARRARRSRRGDPQMRKLRGKIDQPAMPALLHAVRRTGRLHVPQAIEHRALGEEPHAVPSLRRAAQLGGRDGRRGCRPRSCSPTSGRATSRATRRHTSSPVLMRFYVVATGCCSSPGPARQDRPGVGSSYRSWPATSMPSPPWDRRGAPARVGHGTSDGPWVPLGAGVHTGPAFVGRVEGFEQRIHGARRHDQRRAHLAAEAKAGESVPRRWAALETSGLERRHLSLKGHEVDALVIAVDDVATSSTGAA